MDIENLLKEHSGLIHPAIRQVIKHGWITEEMEQIGLCGLYEALQGHDATKSTILTRAFNIIRGRVIDSLRTEQRHKSVQLTDDMIKMLPHKEEESKNSCEIADKLDKVLSPREAEIVRLRYGFNENFPDGLDFVKIGEIQGVSRQMIQEIHNRAIQKLRSQLATA
jgi:RNA polymerase sigma factor (sigma-70 family)